MKYFHALQPVRKFLIAACAVSASATLISSPALASTPGATALLYDYEFAGTTGTVANSAPNGPVIPLTLDGNWSAVKAGVKFAGDTASKESVAYGQPASGYTIDEPATAAIGFGARFVYTRPTGGQCFAGTPNITQIGLYNAKPVPTQAKLQLSSCQTSSTQVFVQCRFAGSLTATANADPPVTSTLPLTGGQGYNASCVKSADHSGSTTITLNVTPVSTGTTTTNTFTV